METNLGVALPLPADFRLADTLLFLSRATGSLTEHVAGGRYRRALWLEGQPVVLDVTFSPGAATGRLIAAETLPARAAETACDTLQRVLGLTTDATTFERQLSPASPLAPAVAARPGLRIPQTPTVFEALTWSILGQQVNLAFAYTLRNRLIERCGAIAPEGLRCHPTPAAVAELEPAELLPLQFSRRKAEYLIDIARLVAGGGLDLEGLPAGSADTARERLLTLRGLGPWSVDYLLMRGCGFPDCVPVGDSGLNTALARVFQLAARPDTAQTRALMAPFAPFRSLATTHLWASLGDPA